MLRSVAAGNRGLQIWDAAYTEFSVIDLYPLLRKLRGAGLVTEDHHLTEAGKLAARAQHSDAGN